MQRTLVLIKPDAFERRIVYKILGRIEQKDFKMVDMKFWNSPPRNLIEQHYTEHSGQTYFNDNCDFMTSGPILSIIYEGFNAISRIRQLQGNVYTPGTIRGDLANDIRRNLVHASDTEESAAREIGIWFCEYKLSDTNGTNGTNGKNTSD